MPADPRQIKELLGSGLSQAVVASAVGCDPAVISHMMSEESFSQEVAQLRSVALTAHTKRDLRTDSVEEKLLGLLDRAIDEGAIYKPRDILHAYAVVNGAKRRGALAGTGEQHISLTQNVVQIQLPEPVARRFTINKDNVVVEAEGQTLVTMPAAQMLSKLVERDRGGNGRAYENALKHLPGGVSTTIIGGETKEYREGDIGVEG